jgi:methyl-accepting chemotaxis protein
MLDNVKIGTKLIGGFVSVALISVLIGYIGIKNIRTIDDADTQLYEKQAVPLAQLGQMIEGFQRARVNRFEILTETDPVKINDLIDRIEDRKREIDEIAREFEKTILSDEIRSAYAEYRKKDDKYDEISDKFVELVRQDNKTAAETLLKSEGAKVRVEVQDCLDQLAELKTKHAKQTSDSNTQLANSASNTMVTIIIIGAILAVLIGLFLTRSIKKPLAQGVVMMQEMGQGHLGMRLNMSRQDEIGVLARAMDQFADDLQNLVVGTLKKMAAGDLSTRVAYKDSQDEIAPAMIGITDALNNLIAEMNRMSDEHNRGDIDVTIPVDKFQGSYRTMAQGVNDMVAGHIIVKKKAMACVAEFGKGNFDASLERFPGKKAFINDTIEEVRGNLKKVIEDTDTLAKAAVEGRLATRAEAARHHGDFRRIVQGINDTLDAVILPVNEAAGVLSQMAEGDLSSTVKGDYKGDHARIKDALNTSLSSLNDILEQVNEAVDQVASGSQQVSDSSQSLSQGATEQASSLEEVTASMTELGSQTRQNADSATQANKLAASARDAADHGNRRMQEMLKAMGEINESSTQVSKIIKVIDEIAFQTNLLALNAAVEAARAGVHGKGFAVVAEEVRNLAQRSAKAAKETTELIEGSVRRVNGGTEIAQQTAKALEEIVTGVTKVTDLVGEIASASNEQATGINQVNEALGQIDQVTQANTTNAEESAAAAEELSAQSAHVRNLIAKFKLGGNGHGRKPLQPDSYDAGDGFSKQYRQIGSDPRSGKVPVRALSSRGEAASPTTNGRNQIRRGKNAAAVIALDDQEFGKF